MAGDIDFFLSNDEGTNVAEINIMIAEEQSRRKGLAKEALLLALRYAMNALGK